MKKILSIMTAIALVLGLGSGLKADAVTKKATSVEASAALTKLGNGGLKNSATASVYDLELFEALVEAGGTVNDSLNNKYLVAKIMSDNDTLAIKVSKLLNRANAEIAGEGNSEVIVMRARALVENNKYAPDYEALKLRVELAETKFKGDNTRTFTLQNADQSKKIVFSHMSQTENVILVPDLAKDGMGEKPQVRLWHLDASANNEVATSEFTSYKIHKPTDASTGKLPYILVAKNEKGQELLRRQVSNSNVKVQFVAPIVDGHIYKVPEGKTSTVDVTITEPYQVVELLYIPFVPQGDKDNKLHEQQLPLVSKDAPELKGKTITYDAIYSKDGYRVRVIKYNDGTVVNIVLSKDGKARKELINDKVNKTENFVDDAVTGSITKATEMPLKDSKLDSVVPNGYKPQQPQERKGKLIIEYFDKETKKVIDTIEKDLVLGKMKVEAEELLDYDLVSKEDSITLEITDLKVDQKVRFDYEFNLSSKSKKMLNAYNDSLKKLMEDNKLLTDDKKKEEEKKADDKAGVKVMLKKHSAYISGAGYKSGRRIFLPNKQLSRAEATQMLYNSTNVTVAQPMPVTFMDISGKWYEAAVSTFQKAGIIGTESPTTFSGNSTMTRGEFAKFIAKVYSRAMNEEIKGTASFTDTQDEYVGYLVSKGVISGFPDGTFKPHNGLTRAEAVIIMNTVLDVTPGDTAQIFADVPASHWAAAAINGAAQ